MSTQTDPNAAYNAKVREIARELAKDQLFGSDLEWEEMEETHRQLYISSKLRVARAMVAKMANEYRAGLFAGRESNKKWASIKTVDAELMERGLIPNTKTDDNVV